MPGAGFLEIARMNMLLHQVDGELGRRDIADQEISPRDMRTFSRIISNLPSTYRTGTEEIIVPGAMGSLPGTTGTSEPGPVIRDAGMRDIRYAGPGWLRWRAREAAWRDARRKPR
jgi:hypothetical protein